ncbi:MAG: hypothetical protein OXQ29_02860 [Rhodospirillaceae bacterium]|nr:hypothetical protein [Rhodospirillaceae bacterium]
MINLPKWLCELMRVTMLSLVSTLAMSLEAQDETPTTEPRSFSSGDQTRADSKPDTSTPREWSAKMESLVWTVLQESGYEITRIERITCNEPTCEIHFTGVGFGPLDTRLGPGSSDLLREVMIALGVRTDVEDEFIVKQGNLGSREEYPGSRLMILRLSTEPPDLPRRLDGFTPILQEGDEPQH